ncbi:hypothetical protein CJ030_MR5G015922 [Morella rubra]|uniref:Uncharacterized protein n=1 Tax=Morella rubra TaxID=262757 RepID=A0A6A1VQQ9_9ROSI|nr:hypothetical protein CJ030_MR5G015922 [Morella rubra]
MVLVEEGTNSCSRGELPATLKRLFIVSCQKLESIAKSLHRNSFLESIDVRECENLKALPTGIQSLSLLHDLFISDCPNLVPFPDGERVFLPPNFRYFCVDTGISSIREITLPSNLTSLWISRLEITEILLESGLHRLSSLKMLKIDGGCPYLVSFPTPEMLLPTSLTSLSIASFPKLQNLSSEGLLILASLKELFIVKCEELTSFPEDGLPPSLLELHIVACGKLTSFPEDGLPPSLLELHIVACGKLTSFPNNGLPPSLLQLRITGCPLLEENCKKDLGREWSKIAHIPYVEIDGKFVYDA